jgi:sortase B
MDETPKKKPSKNKKIRRTASNVIMICLAGIMLVSGWRVFTIMKNYQADRSVYNKISEQAGDAEDAIDFDALKKINPDVIGWLFYKDTIIDYPVVKGENNEMYLSMLFDRTWGGCGTLFADCVTKAPFKQFNTIVYGHHMKDGTMFACLKELRDPEYCEKNPKLELSTPEGKFDLEIWAFLNEPSDSNIYMTNIEDEEEKQKYLDLIEKLADYTTDVKVTTEDRLVMLSTCAYEFENARYIIACKMVPQD